MFFLNERRKGRNKRLKLCNWCRIHIDNHFQQWILLVMHHLMEMLTKWFPIGKGDQNDFLFQKAAKGRFCLKWRPKDFFFETATKSLLYLKRRKRSNFKSGLFNCTESKNIETENADWAENISEKEGGRLCGRTCLPPSTLISIHRGIHLSRNLFFFHIRHFMIF